MKIIVAKNAGFCPGVNTALNKVIELSKKTNKKIYTLGPLIHNKDVIKKLEEKNIYSIENINEIDDIKNSILVIRAHGISPAIEEEIKKTQIEYIDATCPLVKKVHKIIEKYEKLGYTTIILGDPHHAEVIGLKGYSKNPYIITSEKDAINIGFIEKAILVSQTTQEIELFEKVIEILKKKVKDLIINDTICNPTKERQKETIQGASSSDLVVVIGGKHSANTQRLYQICQKLSKKAILVENENEIEESFFKGTNTVFITAGASTPAWLIERVYKKIEEINSNKHQLKNILNFIQSIGIFTFISAISIIYYIYKTLNTNINFSLFISLSLAIVAAYIINRKREIKKIEDDIKKEFFIKYPKTINFIMYCFLITSLLFALKTGIWVFIIISVFLLLSSMYSIIKKNLKIPALKDFLTAAGWSFVLGLGGIINIKTEYYINIAIIIFVFLIALQRNILISIILRKNDIIQQDTLLNDLGENITYLIFYISIFIIILINFILSLKLAVIIPLLNYLIISIVKKEKKLDLVIYEIVVDMPYIILIITNKILI